MAQRNSRTFRRKHSTPDAAYVLNVTLHAAGKYLQYTCPSPPPAAGTPVVVETERGVCLGWVVCHACPASEDQSGTIPSVIRVATLDDLLQEDRNREREQAAFRICLQLIRQHQMEMKLVKVHYLLNAAKAVFYFTADGRVDFRALVKDLAAELRIRIEMRQIGVRDETKVLGGVGHCGRELCCSSWLRNFVPVSIRMAKDQNLALNPQKVSGACGRLMCCLAYEHETYVDMKRGLPKMGRRVNTTMGSGRVSNMDILKQRFVVELDSGGRVTLGPGDLLSARESEMCAGRNGLKSGTCGKESPGASSGPASTGARTTARAQRRSGKRTVPPPSNKKTSGT